MFEGKQKKRIERWQSGGTVHVPGNLGYRRSCPKRQYPHQGSCIWPSASAYSVPLCGCPSARTTAYYRHIGNLPYVNPVIVIPIGSGHWTGVGTEMPDRGGWSHLQSIGVVPQTPYLSS
jgi:hypothetical protein